MVLGSTLLLWLVSLSAAALSCVVSLVKLIDRRRQRLIPSHGEFSQVLGAGHDLLEFLPRRRAPVFASTPTEKVARYRDVAPIIRTGDVLLFSGRTFLSYIIRIFTFSTVSHVGLALRDEGGLWVVDSCEGKGVTKRLLADEIKRWPGQWYFAEIATGHRTHYSRKSVAAGAQAMIGQQYGWIAIAVQAVLHAPVLRELAYFAGVDRWFPRMLPFCSAAAAKLMRIGGIDPVRARDLVLITPQDIHQSAVISEPIALVP